MGASHTPAPPYRCQERLSSIKCQRQLTAHSHPVPETCHSGENKITFSLEPYAVCTNIHFGGGRGVTQLEVSLE